MKSTLFSICTILIFVLISSCKATKETNTWRKPDSEKIKFNKVLVIGMSNDVDVRTTFEHHLSKSLNKKGINAKSSLDFFGDELLNIPTSLEAWQPLIKQLKSNGIDAVLVTKVIAVEGKDSKSGIVRHYNNFFASFEEDVMKNKNLYSEEEGLKDFYIHQVASSLYCLCEQELEEDLIWKNTIEIKQAFDAEHTVEEGVRLFSIEFIEKLKKQELFIEAK
ncbi:hypothetical protein [Mesonia aquimarina]|uniref:hypothetical protein n=1 Tax=Mesonia aquimarina TaxID=1504967 RepID=UPI000EF5A6DE|nr:hypothetical protein [Mesonia aquimarina]